MPPPSSGRSAGAEGRYTVVYEGDPGGVRILNGEPAPGRAIGIMAGDFIGDWIDAAQEVRRLTRERDAAREAANAADARVVAIATERADMIVALRKIYDGGTFADDGESYEQLLQHSRPAGIAWGLNKAARTAAKALGLEEPIGPVPALAKGRPASSGEA